jgi:hypothetical protein
LDDQGWIGICSQPCIAPQVQHQDGEIALLTAQPQPLGRFEEGLGDLG